MTGEGDVRNGIHKIEKPMEKIKMQVVRLKKLQPSGPLSLKQLSAKDS